MHQQQVAVDVQRPVVEAHLRDDHPLFPALDGVDHVMAQQALEHLVVLFEHQILQPGAELRIHEPFADSGAEDLQDAFTDMLVLPRGGGRDLCAAG